MKYLLQPCLSRLSSWIEGTVAQEDLQGFFHRKIEEALIDVTVKGDFAVPVPVVADLFLAHTLGRAASLIPLTMEWPGKPPCSIPAPPQDPAKWAGNLPHGQVLHKNILVAGAGQFLDLLATKEGEQYRSLVDPNLEKLLLHVEVKRRHCFPTVTPETSREQLRLERHDIAILFCRHARRTGDLRMLNAALKLNDWAFPRSRRGPSRQCLARYLLALAEQEKAMQELLR